MLGMHPIFTLLATCPDMTTAAGAASYTRQLITTAGLRVMLCRPGSKTPWDTRTEKEKEADNAFLEQQRHDNPELDLPDKISGFYLASDNPNRVAKLLRAGYKHVNTALDERAYLIACRNLHLLKVSAETGEDTTLSRDEQETAVQFFHDAQATIAELTADDAPAIRKNTARDKQLRRAQRIVSGDALTPSEIERLEAIDATFPPDNPWPNLAVEVGGSAVVVADCDTAEETAWFKEWAAGVSGDDSWLHTLPTVKSPGVFDDKTQTWKHRDGGHYWFSIGQEGFTDEETGRKITPLPDSITKLTITKPGTDVSFTLMVNKCFVLIPPSQRAEGAYVASGPSHIMPLWLYDHIIGVEADRREQHRRRMEERAKESGLSVEDAEAVELWWNTTTWDELLTPLGWTRYGNELDSCGCPIYSRPGGASPKSATGHVHGCSFITDSNDPPIHFWTDLPGEVISEALQSTSTGGKTLSKLQLYAAVFHGGDMCEALRSAVDLSVDSSSHMEYTVTQMGKGVAMVDSTVVEGDDAEIVDNLVDIAGLEESSAPRPTLPNEAGKKETSASPTTPPQAGVTVENISRDAVENHDGDHIFNGDDTTYEATEEEEAEVGLEPPSLPLVKEDIPVYKTTAITDNKVQVRSLDWLRKNRPPVRFLIRDWIQEGTVSLIVGPSNAGKSAVVLDMMCTMAAEAAPGESDFTMWMNSKAKRRNILYIAGEGVDGVTNRVTAWERHHRREVGDHLAFLEEAFRFDSPESSWVRLGQTVMTQGIDIVVFDTLAMMMTGMEENSNDDMGKVMAWLENFRRITGTTVLLVHHTTKSADNLTPRGASALTGAVASQILVTKRDPESLDRDVRDDFASKYITPIRVAVTKQKDGRYPDPMDLTLVPAPVPPRLDSEGNELEDIDDFGDPRSTYTVLLGDSMGSIPTANSVADVEYTRRENPRMVASEFSAFVLESLVNRVAQITSGPYVQRRLADASKARLLSYLNRTTDLHQFNASSADLSREFERSLDTCYGRNVVENENDRIVPSRKLTGNRADVDKVRELMLGKLKDLISVDKFVSPTTESESESGDGGEDNSSPVPTALPDGSSLGDQTTVTGVANGAPKPTTVMPESERRRGPLRNRDMVVVLPQDVTNTAPGVANGMAPQPPKLGTPPSFGAPVAPVSGSLPRGFSPVVPTVSDTTVHPTSAAKQPLPQVPSVTTPVTNSVTNPVTEPVTPSVTAPVTPTVTSPVPPTVTAPVTAPVTPPPVPPRTVPIPPTLPVAPTATPEGTNTGDNGSDPWAGGFPGDGSVDPQGGWGHI